jgi:diacylglycerol O-acyltransferase / wax synthase
MADLNGIELMGPIDRAWLEMDDPRNPMVIGALFQLEGPVDAAAFQKSVVERLLRYPRFRQRVDGNHRMPHWVPEPDLDFHYHVQVHRLHSANFERELRKAVSAEMSRPLNHAKPLWRLLLYPQAGGPITVLFRAHHAVADGLALVTLLIDSTDSGMLRAPPPPQVVNGKPPHHGPLGDLIDQLEAFNTGLDKLQGLARNLRRSGRALQQFREGRATLGAIRRVLRLPEDNPASLGRELSGRRSVAWINHLPLEPLRKRAAGLDVRVNDLFIAALAGALGRYLRRRERDMPEQQNLRVSVPVNLRAGRGRELGNRFGLILLDLPIGITDPRQRLALVVERIAALKESAEAKATLWGLTAAGHLPVPFEKKLVSMISAKSVAVVSNLPGPKRHVRLAGARLKNLVFWPPQAGGMGVGISFFSYAGELSVGLSADRNVIPNPQLVLDFFREELAALHALTDLRAGAPAPEAVVVAAPAPKPKRKPAPRRRVVAAHA